MPALTKQFVTGQNTLSTTAEVLAAQRSGRRRITIRNHDGSILVYVGNSAGVTSGTGFALGAGATIELESDAAVYMIAASGTPLVSFIEEF
jgi:hypothetical protein